MIQQEEKKLKSLTVPEEIKSDSFWRLALILYFIWCTIGLIFGFLISLSGFILLIHGIVDRTQSILFKFLGVETHLTDVPGGVVFVIFGVIVILFSRFSIKRK